METVLFYAVSSCFDLSFIDDRAYFAAFITYLSVSFSSMNLMNSVAFGEPILPRDSTATRRISGLGSLKRLANAFITSRVSKLDRARMAPIRTSLSSMFSALRSFFVFFLLSHFSIFSGNTHKTAPPFLYYIYYI